MLELRRDGDYWLLHNGIAEVGRLDAGTPITDNIVQSWMFLKDIDEQRAGDLLAGVALGLTYMSIMCGLGAYISPEDIDERGIGD